MEFQEVLTALAIAPADGPRTLKIKLARSDGELTAVAGDLEFALSRAEKLVKKLERCTRHDSILTLRLLLEDTDTTHVLNIVELAQFAAKLIHARKRVESTLKAMSKASGRHGTAV